MASPEREKVDLEEMAQALATAAELRMARERLTMHKAPTADQIHYRTRFSSKSKKTPSQSTSPTYTPTMGRRTTALYRLSNVIGMRPNDYDTVEKALTTR